MTLLAGGGLKIATAAIVTAKAEEIETIIGDITTVIEATAATGTETAIDPAKGEEEAAAIGLEAGDEAQTAEIATEIEIGIGGNASVGEEIGRDRESETEIAIDVAAAAMIAGSSFDTSHKAGGPSRRNLHLLRYMARAHLWRRNGCCHGGLAPKTLSALSIA